MSLNYVPDVSAFSSLTGAFSPSLPFLLQQTSILNQKIYEITLKVYITNIFFFVRYSVSLSYLLTSS